MQTDPWTSNAAWRTSPENHVNTMVSMVSIDFFTVPTIRFQVLYVFLVLAHDRRRIVFNVTTYLTSGWRSNCGTHFRSIRCQSICFVTGMEYLGPSSVSKSEIWK